MIFAGYLVVSSSLPSNLAQIAQISKLSNVNNFCCLIKQQINHSKYLFKNDYWCCSQYINSLNNSSQWKASCPNILLSTRYISTATIKYKLSNLLSVNKWLINISYSQTCITVSFSYLILLKIFCYILPVAIKIFLIFLSIAFLTIDNSVMST